MPLGSCVTLEAESPVLDDVVVGDDVFVKAGSGF